METMPPPQKKRRISDHQYFPPELLEQILLNLPVKSLFRFSTVSKSWNSTIHSRDFATRYRGREMIVLRPSPDSDTALDSPLSSVISGNPMASFPRPLPSSRVRASCGELWCVESEDGSVICLYNPSTGTCRELPPASPTTINTPTKWITYGLGYDSVTDDYKVLKLNRNFTGDFELYSRRSNSWRMLGGSRENLRVCMSSPYYNMMDFHLSKKKSVFVNGLLHWILIPHSHISDRITLHRVFAILSFDLSTEKFEKVAMPVSVTSFDRDLLDLGVLRGKLCVYIEDLHGRDVVWVHDGGVWTKEVVIYCYFQFILTKEVRKDYSQFLPVNRSCSGRDVVKVKPLYSYNNNIIAFVAPAITKMFLCEDGSTQLVEKDFGCGELDSCTYVESIVEP